MKKLNLLLLASALSVNSFAQISVDANDMPVSGDTLRYSIANALTANINLYDSGANKTWTYTNLTPTTQNIAEYKTALQVNPLYALTISTSAYGYKVADSFALPGSVSLPITIKDIYNFFSKKTSPSRFVTEAFAANISGIPTPIDYSDEDELYFFPLQYGDSTTSTFKLTMSIPTLGAIKQQGTRTTKVDGWGTITTPFFSTPVNCIRVRSEIDEVDSVQISSMPALGLPRKTVEYKWLAKGEHYPVLWVTTNVVAGTETVTNVRYRDQYRPLSVTNTNTQAVCVNIYPNPATDEVNISIPTNWNTYTIEVFDLSGKLVAYQQSNSVLNVSKLSVGNYIVRVVSGNDIAFAQFNKQ